MSKEFNDADKARKRIQTYLFPALVKLGYDAEFVTDGQQRPLHEYKIWSTIDARFCKNGVGLIIQIYPHGDPTHFIFVQPAIIENVTPKKIRNHHRWNNPASILKAFPDPNELKIQTYNFFQTLNLYYLVMSETEMFSFGRYVDHSIEHYELVYTNPKRKDRLDRMALRHQYQVQEYHKGSIFVKDLETACKHT